MSGDVLAQVGLPGWALVDAILQRNGSRDGEEIDGDGEETAVAAQRRRWRLRLALGLAAWCVLWWTSRWADGAMMGERTATTALVSHSETYPRSNGRHPRSPSTRNPRHSDLVFNSTAYLDPVRRHPGPPRITSLRQYISARTSAFDARSFISLHSKAGIGIVTPQYLYATITAVIVHSPEVHIDSTQLVVDMASRYPFVREIIVWNNDLTLRATLSVPLSAKLGFPAPVLRLINAPTSFSHPSSQPIHRLMPPSHGKHHACSLASHSACLFLSPSLLPIHLDSLYTLYLSIFSPAYKQSQADPSSHSQTSSSPAPSPPLQAAAIVNADTYYRLQHLRFENHEVDLHTGLLLASPQSDLQEHIASKEASRRWFRQMYTLNPDFAIGDDAADAVWSTWMNAPPRLLVAPPMPIVESTTKVPVNTAARRLQDSTVLAAVQSLYDVLKAQDPFLSPEPFPLARPTAPVDSNHLPLLAPSHDDRAIFISNMHAFEKQPSALPFRLLRDDRKARLARGLDSVALGGHGGLLARIFGKKQVLSTLEQAAGNQVPLAGDTHFDPYLLESMGEYEALWHNNAPSSSSSAFWSDADMDKASIFPPTLEDWKLSLSPYRAVNGRLPVVEEGDADGRAVGAKVNATCWTSPLAPTKGDFFGLYFTLPRHILGQVTVYGSEIFGNIVGANQEDLTAESWDVETLAATAANQHDLDTERAEPMWIKRTLENVPTIKRLSEGAQYWRVSFTLQPLRTEDAADMQLLAEEPERKLQDTILRDETTETGDEEGDQVMRIRKRSPPVERDAHSPIDDDDDDDHIMTPIRQNDNRRIATPFGSPDAIGNSAKTDAIRAIRFTSRDRKGSRIKVCGWIIDDATF